jgi:hypothetical protein
VLGGLGGLFVGHASSPALNASVFETHSSNSG